MVVERVKKESADIYAVTALDEVACKKNIIWTSFIRRGILNIVFFFNKKGC